MVFPSGPRKVMVGKISQPKLVEKATGQLYLLVRDDVEANGKLYVAPMGMMTSMISVKPDVFKERFEWYVDPQDRSVPVMKNPVGATDVEPLTKEQVEKSLATKPKGGRPKGSKDTKPRKKRSS